MRTLLWFAALAGWVLVSAAPILAADKSLEVTVKAGKYDRTNTPITVLINAPADAKSVTLIDPAGKKIPAQLTAPGLRSGEAKGKTELHFILPSLKQGGTLTLKADFSSTPDAKGFAWKVVPDEYAELSRDGKPAVRYMCIKLTDKNRNEAGKVYHHIYDPAGTRFITKGPGGLYPHHRGLYFGYVNITYDGGHADTWYANGQNEVHTSHLAQEAGPVLGRHLAAVDWVGSDKKPFINEKRELAVYAVPGGEIIDFTSRLAATAGKVKLDGNAPHAGFHFRADQEVAAKAKAQTYFLRPDGKGALGKARDSAKDVPWDAMSFVLGDKRYTVLYCDRPDNPKPVEYNERDYARFGSFFKYELEKGKDLQVSYRLWLQDGEMTGDQAAAISRDFLEPPEVVVK